MQHLKILNLGTCKNHNKKTKRITTNIWACIDSLLHTQSWGNEQLLNDLFFNEKKVI
jgi:hypothetical protein